MAMPGKHEGHDTSAFGRKALISALLSIPVILYSNLPEELFGWSAPSFSGSSYLALAFSSVIFFYGGFVFLKGAWIELRGRLPGMMTLISVAITAAYLWSVAAVFLGKGDVLFWELATLITVMLVGHWLEMRAVKGAQSALKELSKLLPDTAEVLRGGRALVVPLSEVREGDMVVVRPGAKISADGVVAEGSSEVDESIATGESKPVPKKKESEVIAGTVNGDGSLTVKVTKIGEHTFLAGVMRLVREAEASKSRLQILSDRAAFYLTIIATAAGTATLAVWLGAGSGVGFAVERMVAVLVIACPHALGLAVPLVASISTTKAAKSGFLVKRRLALEAARAVDTVLFDKTGTLTKGEYGVVKVLKGAVQDEKEILRLAASVNAHSEHAAGKGAVSRARELGISFLPVKDFARVPGKGAEGVVEGAKVCVGGEAIIEYAGARLSPELERQVRSDAKKGWTMNYVIRREEILGVIALADVIRQESREATQALKAMGVRVAMVTGDSEDVARWVAEELSIGEYFARVLPHEKSEKVKLLQLRGRKVAMVGDGVNDAPALTQADVGIAIGAGTNVAIEPAGIILVRNDPRDIVKIVRLSRMTYTKMAQNLFWATVYNLAALPLAAGVLASQGILLQPALAAVFMSLSTVIVAVNAVFLRRAKL
jgi:Cu2+-exporting ATPase